MQASPDRPLVAVLGGGQLGRMLGEAGAALGLQFHFLDPSPDATARAFGELTVGALDDVAAAESAARGAEVVTYEWEGVPAGTARAVARIAPVRPSASALDMSQDRLAEKELFGRLGIGVTPFAAVDERADLVRALDEIGLPAVLKTRRGGYDGKGQHVLRSTADLDPAWESLGGVPLVVESLVPFRRELSVLAARGLDGTTRCWPVVENTHLEGILRLSRAPAPDLTPALQAAAEDLALRVLDDLEYAGVVAVELFEHDGVLLANELAPRVHNSGHWTIEGSETSQFEQHLRAILGRPLGSTAMRGCAGMVNCIGELPDRDAVLAVADAHLHDYEKAPRPGRKVGHVTVTAATAAERDDRIAALLEIPSLRF